MKLISRSEEEVVDMLGGYCVTRLQIAMHDYKNKESSHATSAADNCYELAEAFFIKNANSKSALDRHYFQVHLNFTSFFFMRSALADITYNLRCMLME